MSNFHISIYVHLAEIQAVRFNFIYLYMKIIYCNVSGKVCRAAVKICYLISSFQSARLLNVVWCGVNQGKVRF